MTILTDELIEKAARAAYEDWKEEFDGPAWENSAGQDRWKSRARAALTAALPLIVEECAKVAEDHDVFEPDLSIDHSLGRVAASQAIRHLVFCPRSMSHRPDNFPIADCIAAGECGCDNRSLTKKSEPA